MPTRNADERFREKVNLNGGFADFTDPLVRVTEDDGECWMWTGAASNGYGYFWSGERVVLAHRFAAGMAGEAYDHLCRRTLCMRHLEEVGNRENVLRGAGVTAANATKTQCHNGHKLTAENTYTRPGKVERDCRTCRADRVRRFRARRNGGN